MAKYPTVSMRNRIICLLLVLVIGGFGTVCGRLSYLMIFKANDYRTLAEEQQLSDTVTNGKRGNIYDANMNVLAESATAWQVYVNPSMLDDKYNSLVVDELTSIIKVDKAKVEKAVAKKTGYEKIGSPVEADKATKIREFISKHDLASSVGLDETSVRYYPNNNLASTVVGFVGTDNQGLAGIESQYDDELTGTAGRIVSAKNAKGDNLPFSYEKVIDAKAGNSLVLTIDEYVQHVVEKYLDQAIEEYSITNRGCCVVMNVKSGEILAMATKPDFNLNEPFAIGDKKTIADIKKIKDEEKHDKAVSEALQQQWRNKAISDTYEPGSTFKVITGSSALEENSFDRKKLFNCTGSIKINGTTYHCHKTSGHGTETLTQAFENSCNPAFISIGQTLGVKSFCRYRKAFGLEALTGIDLPGESSSILHPASSMTTIQLASESFGQSFKVTPIQLVTAISAAVNGGYLYKPHLVKQVLDEDGNIVKNIDSTLVNQVISEKTSKEICGYLESVVSEGSGSNAYVAGYRIGGKTGTAVKLDDSEAQKVKKYIVSFCGVAPCDDAKIAILMMLDEPHVANPYGGTLVAPVVGNILEEILPYVGVTPEYTEEEAEDLETKTPDVMGKKISEAKNALSEAKLKAEIVGDGKTVVRQVPSASSTIPSGGTVVLYTDKSEKKKTTTVPDFTDMSISEANEAAVNAGINLSISGSNTNSTAYKQSTDAKTEVEIGTVVTVYFREIVTVQ